MKFHLINSQFTRASQLAVSALIFLIFRDLTVEAAALQGQWTPVARESLQTQEGQSEFVDSQTAEVVIPSYGGKAIIRRIVRRQTGAVWLGFDYPKYLLLKDRIVGARTLGSKVLFKISALNTSSEEQLSSMTSSFIQSLTTLEPGVGDEDAGVDLLDVLGPRVFARGRSDQIAHMVAIRSMDWSNGDIGVILSTGSNDDIFMTFDVDLQPWKARFNHQQFLVVDANRITPKSPQVTTWGLPQIKYVAGISNKLAATIRTPSTPLAFNSAGAEVQFMTCVCEDGRVWFGPSGTDLVFTEGEVVGFFFNDRAPKSLEMYRSSERLPLNRTCRQAFETWRSASESSVRAGTYSRKSTIIELSGLLQFDAADLPSIRSDERIIARWIDGQVHLRVDTTEPDGAIRVILGLPNLECVSAEFSPRPKDE